MSLETEIRSIIADSGAEMGVCVRHLESGEEIAIDADRAFPLASVFKIPVLVEAFRQLHAGRFRMEERWELTTAEKNLPSGILVFCADGLKPTARDLLTLMIIISDNTATDMVMHRLGVENVTKAMHELGLTDIHVPLTVRGIFDDLLYSSDPTQDLLELAKKPSNRNGIAYSTGPDNNVGTPRAMTDLLQMIWRGEITSRAACDGMLEVLLKQQLNERLPRFLPAGIPFAHKTGTLGGVRNDSGILYAGDNAHIAVTVFTRWDDQAVAADPIARWERIVAIDSAFGKIGLAVYEQYK